MTFPNFWGQITETVDRIADNVAYAAAQDAGGSMRIEPDKVDELARFFEEEAEKMEMREQDVALLADVPAPGVDPVSTGAVATYAKVAVGSPTAYMENYQQLATVFKDAANALRESSRQVRTDDDTSAHSIKS